MFEAIPSRGASAHDIDASAHQDGSTSTPPATDGTGVPLPMVNQLPVNAHPKMEPHA